jgi:hypothetical protein
VKTDPTEPDEHEPADAEPADTDAALDTMAALATGASR